jgi:hypothetical protein
MSDSQMRLVVLLFSHLDEQHANSIITHIFSSVFFCIALHSVSFAVMSGMSYFLVSYIPTYITISMTVLKVLFTMQKYSVSKCKQHY